MSANLPNIQVDRDWLLSHVEDVRTMDGPSRELPSGKRVVARPHRFYDVRGFIDSVEKVQKEHEAIVFLYEAYVAPNDRLPEKPTLIQWYLTVRMARLVLEDHNDRGVMHLP